MTRVCPERITQARELAGWSKSELAELLKVSPAAITKWETGVKRPQAADLVVMAGALEVPLALLFRPKPVELGRKGPLTFRSRLDAPARRLNRKAETLAEMVAEVFLWVGERVNLPAVALPEIEHGPLDQAELESVAQQCRRAWGLGDRPILKMGELLESKGIILGRAAFGDARFDAFSCVIDGRPFLFLGTEKQDRARTRFDAAHELGHLLLHQHLGEPELGERSEHLRLEREANIFGGAFLMPAETVRRDLHPGLTLPDLLRLKSKWGVSAQALAHRAHDLGIIGGEHYHDLFSQMGKKRWRRPRGEPLDELVPEVHGRVGRKSLDLLEANGALPAEELAGQLPLPARLLAEVFGHPTARFEPKPPGQRKIISLDTFTKAREVFSSRTAG